MGKRFKNVAVVHCVGGCELNGTDKACRYGCIGCGACVDACRKGAVELVETSSGPVAHVDREKCVGCGLCVKACPQGVVKLSLREDTIQPLCSNRDEGKAAKAACKHSCIACGMCEKNCPAGAIAVCAHIAEINENRCISCGMCAVKCPRGVIHDVNGLLAESF